MLSIQANGSRQVFTSGHSRRPSEEEIEYRRQYQEILDQQDEFEEMAEQQKFKPAKALLTGGAVIAAGTAGALTGGFGAKKTIEGVGKLVKTKPMQSFKKHLIAIKDFVIDAAKTIKEKFITSDAYKMPANFIKKQIGKFKETKLGKPIVNACGKVKEFVGKICKNVKEFAGKIWNKIRGVKSETWKSGTTNVVGASSGIASGVIAMKERDEASKE